MQTKVLSKVKKQKLNEAFRNFASFKSNLPWTDLKRQNKTIRSFSASQFFPIKDRISLKLGLRSRKIFIRSNKRPIYLQLNLKKVTLQWFL